ncbi:hypothetical protein HA402_007661 [Bradysia odoriphaga]|nr:hypothetical protein HA402_007661 [Bradysia odoriphaga]
MREMERHKRVEEMLQSRLFREELERIVNCPTWGENATMQCLGAQVTARLNEDQELFLVNQSGILSHEVTASSLNKVDMQGNVVQHGTTNFGINTRRKYSFKYPKILASLTVDFFESLQITCYIRLSMQHVLIFVVLFMSDVIPSLLYLHSKPEARKTIYDASRKAPEGYETKANQITDNNKDNSVRTQSNKWRVRGAEFEALMRMLDNAGFRTGYIYRNPLVKSELPKPRNDVEEPPAVSSLGYLLEEEELYRQGIWKKSLLGKGGYRSRWLNSPNVYQKVEVLETGT